MSKKHKTTANGFTWLLVTEKASEILSSGLFDIYGLYDDDSEFQIFDHAELSKAFERGLYIGIEVGFTDREITEEGARNYLTKEGFFTENLWHLDDVKSKFECSDDKGFDVLRNVLGSEYMISCINDSIIDNGNALKLKEKEEENEML